MSLLDQVSETLAAAGIRHAIIGAMALATHGVNRATVDTDLLVVDSTSLLPALWSDLADLPPRYAKLWKKILAG